MALGCKVHAAYIYDRGGMRRIGRLTPLARVQYDRVRDDISSALLTIENAQGDCGKMLGEIEAGRHEVVIFRGDGRTWEGPITRIAYGRSSVTIEARDVWHYAYRTILRSGYDNAHPNVGYVTVRAEKMLRAELARKEAQDPPINVLPYLDVRTHQDTARTSRRTLPFQKTLWEDIDDMAAKGGLDYTAIGRRMLVFDTHDAGIGRTRMMTEDDFLGDVVVTQYGMELATYSAVTDGEGRWGSHGGVDPYYGEVEILETVYEEGDNSQKGATADPEVIVSEAEMRSQAQRNMAGRYPTPVVVRVPDGSALNPGTGALMFEDLVPGVRIPLRSTSTYRVVNQEQKLDKVRVIETEEGETIQVTMSPSPGVSPWIGDDSDAAPA